MQSTFVSDVLNSRLTPSPDAADDAFEQPLSRRAAFAVALAPVLVLMALTLVIGDVVEPHLGLLGVLVSITWLVLEMHHAMTRPAAEG